MTKGALSSERFLAGVISGWIASATWIFAATAVPKSFSLIPVNVINVTDGIAFASVSSESILAVALMGFVGGISVIRRPRLMRRERTNPAGSVEGHSCNTTSVVGNSPILRMFDEAQARDFYVTYLGFTIDWEHRFQPDTPLCMQVSKGGCVLHLAEHHPYSRPATVVRITTTDPDLDLLHEALAAKERRASRLRILDRPFGTRDLSVRDPFGNRLTFTTAVNM